MLKIIPGQFIDISTMQGYDSLGQPELQVTVQGNYELTNMQNDITMLQSQIRDMLLKQENEARLRAANPALQDVHDKYQIVYELVKRADTATGTSSG